MKQEIDHIKEGFAIQEGFESHEHAMNSLANCKNGVLLSDYISNFLSVYSQALEQPKWLSVDERLPIATESGNWDGLRSDLVLAVNRQGDYVIARVYLGFMDGHNFSDWCNSNDDLLDTKSEQIVKWKPID